MSSGLLLVLGVVLAAHANSLGGDLVLDARPLILENPAVRQVTLANLWTLLSSPYWHPLANDGLYRPVTTLSYLVNYAVLRNATQPFGYHLVNLVLHLGCVALVYELVRTMIGRTLPAALAAALFGLHPVTTEAVANIVGRADLLAAIGVLGGLLCHIRAVHDGRAPWRAGLLVAAVIAAFSKETGLVLIGVLLLYDFVLDRGADRPDRPVVSHYAMVAAVAVVYLAMRWTVAQYAPLRDDPSALDNPILEASLVAGRATAVKVLGHELALLVWPATLSADYSFAQIPVVRLPPESWDDWQAAVVVVAIAGLAVGVLRARRRLPTLAFFFLFLFVTLLPTANLVVAIGTIMADRFLYLPLVGFVGMVAVLADRVLQDATPLRQRVVLAVLGMALVACALRTFVRNRDWQSDAMLAARTVETSPRSAKARSGYGAVLFEDGNLERIEAAVAEEERAVAIRPDYLQALINLGRYQVAAGEAAARAGRDAQGWYTKAVATLDRAVTVDEGLNRRFAEKMLAGGRGAKGIPEIGHLEVYEALAMATARLGHPEESVAALEHARRLAPTDTHWYLELAATLEKLGRWEEAAIVLFQAMAIRPNSPEPPSRLAMLYRTSDPNGGEVFIPEPSHLTIALDHPIVRRHRCEAYRRLGEIFTRANLPQAAANAAEVAAGICPDR